MVVINDATVVASAYNTSGNGGRKLVRLDNGWLISAVSNNSNSIKFYRSKDNGNTWNGLTGLDRPYYTGSTGNVSLVVKGKNLYVLYQYSNSRIEFIRVDCSTANDLVVAPSTGDIQTLTTNETTTGNVSLAINDTGTELHATWASKNATYPNSFNIRYAKGTINIDGSVTWGVVEQVSLITTAVDDIKNPSIIVDDNNYPLILVDTAVGSFSSGTSTNSNVQTITAIGKNPSFTKSGSFNSNWGYKTVYDGSIYPQYSPSAIFVPQSINGLANGRIWVAWHGTDATETGVDSVRVSYSDNGGNTWSSMQKLTTGVTSQFPSITANKSKVFIVYGKSNGIAKLEYTTSWSADVYITPNTNYYFPSSLFDVTFSLNFTEPLFIYKGSSKVGFYGTWTVTTISVTQGSIGTKSDKNNILSYSITTDGTMSTITEKVNGVTVGTKTATSGESLITGLTQAQWDAVRFGKYHDNLLYPSNLEIGTVNADGTLADSTIRVRTVNFISVESSKTYPISINSGYSLLVRYYLNGNFVSAETLGITNGSITIPSNANQVKLSIKRDDNLTITVLEVQNANPYIKGFNNNTLTVEMGSDTWTYTFDKRLATTDDIQTAIKAVQDSQDTFLPAVKAKIGSAIRGKGGTVLDVDSLEIMATGIENLPVKKSASGTITATSASTSFTNNTGTTNTLNFLPFDMSLLPFVPSEIRIIRADKTPSHPTIWFKDNEIYVDSNNYGNVIYTNIGFRCPYINGVVNIPVVVGNATYKWEAKG